MSFTASNSHSYYNTPSFPAIFDVLYTEIFSDVFVIAFTLNLRFLLALTALKLCFFFLKVYSICSYLQFVAISRQYRYRNKIFEHKLHRNMNQVFTSFPKGHACGYVQLFSRKIKHIAMDLTNTVFSVTFPVSTVCKIIKKKYFRQ
jgi:hypothetical protein